MKIGIFVCENSPKAGGADAFARYYCKRFGQKTSGDEWVPIYVTEGQFPSDNEIPSYDGFIVTGSQSSATDNFEWIRNLQQFILKMQKYNEGRQKKIKLFGICFGHQIIAKTFGATVGANPSQKMVLGAEEIHLDEDFMRRGFVRKSLGLKRKNVNMFEIHNEQVLTCPKLAKVVGWSNSAKHEMLAYDDWMVSTQGHPEYTVEGLLPLFSACMGVSKDQQIIATQKECNNSELVEMVRSFFKVK